MVLTLYLALSLLQVGVVVLMVVMEIILEQMVALVEVDFFHLAVLGFLVRAMQEVMALVLIPKMQVEVEVLLPQVVIQLAE